MIDTGNTVALAPDVIVQTIDGEALMLKLHDEEVFSLNDTAARIAQLIKEGDRRIDDVVDVLSTEYGLLRADIAHEVGRLMEEFLARGLVVVHSGR